MKRKRKGKPREGREAKAAPSPSSALSVQPAASAGVGGPLVVAKCCDQYFKPHDISNSLAPGGPRGEEGGERRRERGKQQEKEVGGRDFIEYCLNKGKEMARRK